MKGDIAIDRGTEEDHGLDLVEYYVYPRLGSAPTSNAKPVRLIRTTVAVLDGGKFWSVQGFVANESTMPYLFGTIESATSTWTCRETNAQAEVEIPKNIDAPRGDIDPLRPGNIGSFQIVVKPNVSGPCTPVPQLTFRSRNHEVPYEIDPGAQILYRE